MAQRRQNRPWIAFRSHEEMTGKRWRRHHMLDVNIRLRLLPKVLIAAVPHDAGHLIGADALADRVQVRPIAADETFVDPNEPALFAKGGAGSLQHWNLHGLEKVKSDTAELHHQKLVLSPNVALDLVNRQADAPVQQRKRVGETHRSHPRQCFRLLDDLVKDWPGLLLRVVPSSQAEQSHNRVPNVETVIRRMQFEEASQAEPGAREE